MIAPSASAYKANILIVDDTPANLSVLALLLKKEGLKIRPVPSGKLALQAAAADPPDLVLLDINMPDMDGYEVCRRLKADDGLRSIPIIFLSALNDTQDKITAFAVGGVDYVTKPFQVEELTARVETHLTLSRLRRQIEEHNHRLRELVQEQVQEISDSQLATIVALSSLAESRDDATGMHIRRVQAYCRLLALRLRTQPNFSAIIDTDFVANLAHAGALHDIGKVGVPDRVLLKAGPLDAEELILMRAHTTIGASTLETVNAQYPNNGLIIMGIAIARSHHERWDGSGYPDGLQGEAIPLAARILAVADQYDALRSARPYKPAFSHLATCGIIISGDGRTMPSHFDPRILQAFKDSVDEFDYVFASFNA